MNSENLVKVLGATLIRINPREPEVRHPQRVSRLLHTHTHHARACCPLLQGPEGTISIAAGGLATLRAIDELLCAAGTMPAPSAAKEEPTATDASEALPAAASTGAGAGKPDGSEP